MRSYLGLIPASARIHKKRNRMTLLCIIISVFMVTSIFSMADMDVRMETNRMTDQHGNWHIMLKNIPEGEMMQIASEENAKAFSRYDVVNYNLDDDFYINDKKAVICGIEDDFMGKIVTQFEKDCDISKNNQIVLSSNSKKSLGVHKGDKIKLNTPFGEKEFTVSGFINDNAFLDNRDSIGAFLNIESFRNTCLKNPEDTSKTVSYLQFRSGINLKKRIADIKTEYNLSEKQLSENTAILGITGFSSNNWVMGMYIVAAVLFSLVLLAGIFMIAGSINSNVTERTKFFGMLRCIGASKKQILKIVRLEALNWCKTAIPIGVILGIISSWVLCYILHYTVAGEFADIPTNEVSIIGIVCGIIVGVLSVWIAALSPARKAASVSPVAAISGNSQFSIGKCRKINENSKEIEGTIGIFHGINSKKNLTLISSSFALCIVIFLLFVSMLQFVDLALPAMRDYSADISIYNENYEKTIDKRTLNELKKLPEVKNAFGRMYSNTEVFCDKGVNKIDLISYDDLQFKWAKEDVVEGSINPLMNDEGYVITVFDKTNPLKVGDKLQIGLQSVEIAAVLSDSPFSTDETPIIICSEDEFEALMGRTGYSVIDIQMTKEGIKADNNTIREIVDEGVIISDRRESNSDSKATYWAFRICVYAFILILATISVFNIINSISMSTSSKIKEYGMMRAIGMDENQLSKMIAAEGFTYAICGLASGLLIGIPIHRFSYLKLITAHFGTSWSIPVFSIVIAVVVIIIATAIAVILPANKIKSLSVIDVIGSVN